MAPRTALSTQAGRDRRRWLALFVVCTAMLMNALDGTVVNVALPRIQHELHFSQASLAWVVDAYLVAFAGFMLMAGRLGDLIGRKRIFLTGLIVFTIASLVCGLAHSQTLLIVARFVQGMFAAFSTSVVLAIIATEFPDPRERTRAMGAYVFCGSAGGSLGLLAGGALTQALDWHWIFFINIPVGIVATILGVLLVPENRGIGVGRGVDVFGSVLITAGLMIGIYAVVKASQYGWTSVRTVTVGVLSLMLLASFLVLESRLPRPIMPLRILRTPSLLSTCVVRAFLFMGLNGCFFLGSLYLEHVRGYGALRTGFAFMPLTIILGVMTSGLTARLVSRFGAWHVLIPALALVIAGLLLFAQLGVHTRYAPLLLVAFVLLGTGMGMGLVPLLTLAMAGVPSADAGLASGIVNVSAQIGGAIGIAVFATVASGRTASLTALGRPLAGALTSGYDEAFVVAAACVAAAALVAIAALHPWRRGSQAPVGTGSRLQTSGERP